MVNCYSGHGLNNIILYWKLFIQAMAWIKNFQCDNQLVMLFKCWIPIVVDIFSMLFLIIHFNLLSPIIQIVTELAYRGDLKADHLKSRLFKVRFQMVWFSNCWALAMLYSQPFEIQTFFTRFQRVAICPDFKWLGFRISDSDHLQPHLLLTSPDFRSPLFG